MNIKQINEEFEHIVEGIRYDECRDDRGWWETSVGAEFGNKKADEIKQFFALTITELLNSLKMEEREVAKTSDVFSGEYDPFKKMLDTGHNQAVRDLNDKIDKILHQ